MMRPASGCTKLPPPRRRGARVARRGLGSALCLALLPGLSLAAGGCRCAEEPPPPAPVPVVSQNPEQRPLGPSLLTEKPLRESVARLSAHLGGDVQALELRVYPTRLVLQAQDSKRASNVDQYTLQGEQVSGPVPVKLQGNGALEDNLFPLAELRLDAIPPLAGKALEELRLEGAHVSYVSVMRNLPESWDIRIRVYVSSPRKDAHLDYDVAGNSLGVRDH